MVNVTWKGGMAFEADAGEGPTFTMDSSPEHGGQSLGLSPMETLLASAAACSGMDVLSILAKKQQKVTSYAIEVIAERTEEGVYPRPYSKIEIIHKLEGENLDPAAVQRAVELSDEKYCSVVATLRATPQVTSRWLVESATPA